MNKQSKNDSIGNILIVGDMPPNHKLLDSILVEHGYIVHGVINSELQLNSVAHKKTDLILLDIRVPEMGGFEVCSKLKQNQQTCDIPIIFLSALDETQFKVRAFEAGAVDYILKPFQHEEVLARVNTHIALSHSQKKLIKARDKLEDKVQQRTLELKDREEKINLLLESTGEGIYVVDTEGICILVNPACAELLGYQSTMQLLGKNMHNLVHARRLDGSAFPIETCPILSIQKPIQLIKDQFCCANGDFLPVEYSAYPMQQGEKIIGTIVSFYDISKRNQMEAMMIQAEKMLSIGGLAAGMAHELNNPLGGILQGLQNIQRRLSTQFSANIEAADKVGIDLNQLQLYLEQRQIFLFMDKMMEAGNRAKNIIQNMLKFSHKAGSKIHKENINIIIDKALELAASDYDLKKKYNFRDIEIICNYSVSIPLVPCIVTEIQQVLLNILNNAAQAICKNKQQNPQYHAKIMIKTAQEENMAVIEVQDNGSGMDEQVRRKVFDPFFTTRPVGQGTGLGLSISYFIICDAHHGQISVSSNKGEGSTFKICLPIK